MFGVKSDSLSTSSRTDAVATVLSELLAIQLYSPPSSTCRGHTHHNQQELDIQRIELQTVTLSRLSVSPLLRLVTWLVISTPPRIQCSVSTAAPPTVQCRVMSLPSRICRGSSGEIVSTTGGGGSTARECGVEKRHYVINT